MRDTVITMKDGTVHEGPIRTYRPEEGWMSLFTVEGRLHFRDMASAVTPKVMDRINVIEDRDEIARARRDGWNGT